MLAKQNQSVSYLNVGGKLQTLGYYPYFPCVFQYQKSGSQSCFSTEVLTTLAIMILDLLAIKFIICNKVNSKCKKLKSSVICVLPL